MNDMIRLKQFHSYADYSKYISYIFWLQLHCLQWKIWSSEEHKKTTIVEC